MFTPCEVLSSTLGTLFECSRVNQYTRIRTPFAYPDGDLIDLFLDDTNGSVVLTDLGETFRWLSSQAVSERRSKKQLEAISDIVLASGVEQFRGMLQIAIRNQSEFANAVASLSQAALRVADLWFTFQGRGPDVVVEEVADFLKAKKVLFERSPILRGRSGNSWRLDFFTKTARRHALVKVLFTGNKAAARRMAEHVVAQWVDLQDRKHTDQTKFVSLFDDRYDVWGQEEFRLVESLSEVAYWSHPEEFVEKLAA